MKKSITTNEELFAGLSALVDSAFPKVCSTCGRTYQTAEDFLSQTKEIDNNRSCLKQSWDDNDVTIVEVYRNCVCGSTLMDSFGNRRDDSSKGRMRRQKVSELQDYLVEQGLQRDVARKELLKVLRGEGSELLKDFKPPNLFDSD